MRLYERACDAPPGPLLLPPAPAEAALVEGLAASDDVSGSGVSASVSLRFPSVGRGFRGVGSAFAISVFFGDADGVAFGFGFGVAVGRARGVGEAVGFGVGVDFGVAVGVAVGVGVGVGAGSSISLLIGATTGGSSSRLDSSGCSGSAWAGSGGCAAAGAVAGADTGPPSIQTISGGVDLVA